MQIDVQDQRSPRAGAAPVSFAGALREDPPYQLFILTSIALAVTAGLTLATLVPLSIVLDWGWGGRYTPLVQAHGQVQVLGWAGLFIMGMAYRLMPRFSGRRLQFPPLAWTSWAALTMALIARLIAQPAGEGVWQRTVLVSSGALEMVAGVAFALVVLGTLLHRNSRAGATGYFFVLGAVGFAVQAGVNLALLVLAAQRGDVTVRAIESSGLLYLQFNGFIVMFILGVASRAVPTFSGLPRPELSAKALALALAATVAAFVIASLWVASGNRAEALFRVEGSAIASLGLLFLAATWLVGIFRPAANRLRPASQPHIWFIRSAFAWLLIAGGLGVYYGARAAVEGAAISPYGLDALRHTIGLGVASLMIVGMAILVLPAFAVRRMHHPTERLLPALILILLNAAAALRVGAAVAAPQWLSTDRYWPMAVGGVLGEGALLLFAALFLRNLLEGQGIADAQIALREGG